MTGSASAFDYLKIITFHEFIGTSIMIVIGCGVGALQRLSKSLGHGSGGWALTAFGWGMAVFVGASVAWHSGAQLNPAVTLGLTLIGQNTWAKVPFYVVGQVLGGMFGALLVYLLYKKQFDTDTHRPTTGTIFYTAPGVRSLGWNTVSEAIATFVLVYWIVQQSPWVPQVGNAHPNYGNIALGYAGVAFAVIGVGAGLGGATGYAINPARDFGPRAAYALLPIRDKQRIDWGYAWVPIVGPLLGAAVAAGLYLLTTPF
ncbi:MAG: MIP/aquaporin family protein [Candidatus Nanopelagicales bacterium]|nr:MIP/aquaporin family protein [Candidatus Nanopelagicales bacterium]